MKSARKTEVSVTLKTGGKPAKSKKDVTAEELLAVTKLQA
jgi:hypothetical protein